ncbi:GapA-binding peptide SR1P [Bacillus sp. NPDC077027]
MGTIVCQDCNETIDQFENEKVTTLYGTCGHCYCFDEAAE